jgi:hypothetical protein
MLYWEIAGILREDTRYAVVAILVNHDKLEIAKRLPAKRLHQRMQLLRSSKRFE